ncbi:hypothetical protein SAMD00019534_119250 [Acytostelium subglobosum LB1]|uniref:hypothetical protein n=1 Tax=Acytostelium subglobosum LB1 TaxID=1410327 RepID=UPI0006450CE0|nr:hypothetical protein SAMD00019534_119250 [Acytostelium subglobosum LB1]GAM28749.1 hypothetical protein SAMD00019534_119250 [Acytostelium subglobosum LB1]|eukprot:XP_012748304.1 hypothetical protein SAMD00019534_119250 [Acytostelium subglobosum LB1]
MKSPELAKASEGEKLKNKILTQRRVVIECFFGRLVNRYLLFRFRYELDHKFLDQDFYNCCQLTNQLIEANALVDNEHSNYRGVVWRRYRRAIKREEERRAAKAKSAREIRKRLVENQTKVVAKDAFSDSSFDDIHNGVPNESLEEVNVNISNSV